MKNERGERLIEFCKKSCFQQPKKRRYKWKSLGDRYKWIYSYEIMTVDDGYKAQKDKRRKEVEKTQLAKS